MKVMQIHCIVVVITNEGKKQKEEEEEELQGVTRKKRTATDLLILNKAVRCLTYINLAQ